MKKKELKKQIEELKEKNTLLESALAGERYNISYLKAENKSKEKKSLEKLLKDYSFAILTDGYRTQVWNDGRWESSIRNIHFSHYEHDIKPEITIEK